MTRWMKWHRKTGQWNFQNGDPSLMVSVGNPQTHTPNSEAMCEVTRFAAVFFVETVEQYLQNSELQHLHLILNMCCVFEKQIPDIYHREFSRYLESKGHLEFTYEKGCVEVRFVPYG